jgi:hypothetical protein
VVQFAIRQRVLHGAGLWGPTAGLALLGLLLIARAVLLIYRIGQSPTEGRLQPGTALPRQPSVASR